MPLPLLAAAKVGTQLAPLVAGLFHRRQKTPNIQAILARYRAEGPDSYLSASDRAAAARTRAGITAGAATAAETQRGRNQSQVLQRGLGGPAAAALESEAAATEAGGREHGAVAEADQLYHTGQEKQNTLFGAELGAANLAATRADARDATFWNSMIDLTGATSQLWAPPATAAAGTVAPATPSKPGSITPSGPRLTTGLSGPYVPPRASFPRAQRRQQNPAVTF